MATYNYICGSLKEPGKHGEFEVEHSVKDQLTFCPKCVEEGVTNQPVMRLISAATPGKVELEGQDLVNHIKSDARRIEREASQNETKYANLLGNDRMQQIQKRIDRSRRGW